MLATINEWAFAAEVLLQGTPSGIDNTVSTYGQALSFRNQPKATMCLMPELPHLNLLITNTNVDRESKKLIQGVRALYDRWPSIMQPIFEGISAISQHFREAVENKVENIHIDEMIVLNQQLLQCLQVSHPAIERVCHIATQHGVSTKLTGAGGGGCTVSLLPETFSDKQTEALINDLSEAGFVCYLTPIGGNGV